MVDLANIDLLDKIWNTSIDAMVISDKAGIILKANNRYFNIYGYSEQEVIEKSFSIIFPENERESQIALYQYLYSQETIPAFFESTIQRKDGTFRDIYSRSEFLYQNGEKFGVLSVITDVTQQKKVEKELKENEEKFRILFEQAGVGVAQINTQTSKFVKINKKYCDIIGYEEQEMLEIDFIKITYPDDLANDLNNMELLKSGQIREFSLEKRLIHKSGRIIWVELSVSAMWNTGETPNYHIAVVSDITEQKQNELQLRKLFFAIEQSPITIIITDTQGTIEYINPNFLQYSGYSPEEVIGANPRLMKSGKTDIKVYKELWRTIKSGKIWNGEFINKNKKGDDFIERAKIAPIFDKNNNIINFIAIKEDITESKNAELTILKQNKELAALNATKNKFFNIIAHDLRNPFNALIGYSELLLNDQNIKDENTKRRFINSIYNTSKNTFKLLENLLTWAQSQTGEIRFSPEKLNLENVFKEMTSVKQEIARPKNINLTYTLEDKFSILADRYMLDTVLRNLIINAIKFTPENGNIAISAKLYDQMVEICISDSGIGMKDEIKNSLFKIEKTNSTQGTAGEKGTGLGLILCKEFVEIHKGKIWVESEFGKGSNFKFTIPVSSKS